MWITRFPDAVSFWFGFFERATPPWRLNCLHKDSLMRFVIFCPRLNLALAVKMPAGLERAPGRLNCFWNDCE
jgi:hypothetical protein